MAYHDITDAEKALAEAEKKETDDTTAVDKVVNSIKTLPVYSNVKKLTLTKSKYTVKVGKTKKIKAKVTLVNNF